MEPKTQHEAETELRLACKAFIADSDNETLAGLADYIMKKDLRDFFMNLAFEESKIDKMKEFD